MATFNRYSVARDVARVNDNIKHKTARFMLELVQDISLEVRKATPWKTGFLRGSWYEAVENPASRVVGGGKGREFTTTVAATGIKLTLSQIKASSTIYILNSANYAKFVEFGTSKMAPRAMVRRTLARVPELAAAVVDRLNKEASSGT